MDKRLLARWLSRVLSRIPTNCKLLYPFYLSAQLTLSREVYCSPHLPAAFDGYRIAYASDIHFGPYLTAQRALELHRKLSGLPADLLILGGDYGATTQDGIALLTLLPPFSFPNGAVGAVGNHDLTADASQVQNLLEGMRDKDVQPVVNDSLTIVRAGQRLSIVSVDDVRMGHPDYHQAARNLQPGDFILFTPHSPDAIPDLRDSEAFIPHLTVCGHTHGGQIALFGHSLHSSSKYRDRYLSGWKRENGMDILISNGVGTSMLPVRFGAKAQYHLITLRKGEEPSHDPKRRMRV